MDQDQYNKNIGQDFTKDNMNQDRNWAIVAYIIFLIPLLAGPKESKFVRYHLNQGILLTITAIGINVAAGILVSIVTGIITMIHPYGILWILPVFTALRLGCSAIIVVLLVKGIMNASKGEWKPLPIIGKYKILTV